MHIFIKNYFFHLEGDFIGIIVVNCMIEKQLK